MTGDDAIVKVLARYEAEIPATFEIDLVGDADPEEWLDAAYAFGLFAGEEMLTVYGYASPN